MDGGYYIALLSLPSMLLYWAVHGGVIELEYYS
jgi:hypothetical protein